MYAEVRMNFYEVVIIQTWIIGLQKSNECIFYQFQLYDISGRIFPAERSITELKDVVERFKQRHPDFLGIKIIVSPHRNADSDAMRKRYETFKKFQ